MAVPKKMYRVHPGLGFFQSTLVTTEESAASLAAEGWADDMPEGFIEGSTPGDSSAAATPAVIDAVVPGDTLP